MVDTSESEQTEKIRNQGRTDGLFRACMDKIRQSHTKGQALRTAALAAGLLTDAKCYAELLSQFYVATAALEKRLDELEASDLLSGKVVNQLRYKFARGYERDLEALLGSEWRRLVDEWTTEPARRYADKLKNAGDAELVAAAFILWGPLVIGGGAALKPRVEKAFGKDATHVFEDVVGAAKGGRSGRRRAFIDCYDALLDDEIKEKHFTFATIVEASGGFMSLNNQMMLSVRQRPWWIRYVVAGVIGVAVAAAAQKFSSASRS